MKPCLSALVPGVSAVQSCSFDCSENNKSHRIFCVQLVVPLSQRNLCASEGPRCADIRVKRRLALIQSGTSFSFTLRLCRSLSKQLASSCHSLLLTMNHYLLSLSAVTYLPPNRRYTPIIPLPGAALMNRHYWPSDCLHRFRHNGCCSGQSMEGSWEEVNHANCSHLGLPIMPRTLALTEHRAGPTKRDNNMKE